MRYSNPNDVAFKIWAFVPLFVIAVLSWGIYIFLEHRRGNGPNYNISFIFIALAIVGVVGILIQPATFQETVVEILAKKTLHAIVNYDVKNLILAGGVSANSGIRKRMEEICTSRGINYTCPEIKYCTDNAAMIASAGYYAYLDGRRADFTLNGQSSMELK